MCPLSSLILAIEGYFHRLREGGREGGREKGEEGGKEGGREGFVQFLDLGH